jgi:hypothetical protein
MQRGLHALAILTVATWLFYALYAASVLASLARFRALDASDIPFTVVPLVGLTASAWLGFSHGARPSITIRMVIEVLLLLLGWLFLTVVMASRGG